MGRETPTPDQRYRTIVAADKRAFDAARATTLPRTFPQDPAALRHMLIPERLLELVPEPEAIQLLSLQIPKFAQGSIIAYLTYPRPLPTIVDNQGVQRVALTPEVDESELALMKRQLIHNGQIDNDTELLLAVNCSASADGQLYINNYQDRPELHSLGIATSFYNRLRVVAKDLGFRFIDGISGTETARNFFKRRGRYSYDELIPAQRTIFSDFAEDLTDPSFATVDFLDPEDIPNFVEPSVLQSRPPQQR